MQEFADLISKLPPEDRPLVEPLSNFLLSFVQALLKTGYYQASHPGATAAKEGLYKEFQAISRTDHELSFVAKEGEQPDILLNGVLSEPILMRKLMTHAMSVLFIPKFMQYFERRHLVSFCLKPNITHQEFDGFIDVMSEHPTATSRMKEMIQQMTEQLVRRQIVNVSTIYEEEMITEERELHWMTRIVLTRLGKDLQVAPLYRHLSADQLGAIKQQVFQDVLRPISSPDVLKEVLVNCDLMRLPEGEHLAEVESRLVKTVRPDRLLSTVTACANDLKRLLSRTAAARSPEEENQYQRLKTIVTLLAPRLWSARESDTSRLSGDLIDTLVQERILSLEELPGHFREELLLRRRTAGYLADSTRYLSLLRGGWVDEPAQFLISILPGLLAGQEFGALQEAVRCLWMAWKLSNPGATAAGRPGGAFLSAIGAARLATGLMTMVQDPMLRRREELLPVVELCGASLIDPLISVIEHADIWVRRNACRILAGVGAPVIPPLLQETERRWESWYFVRNAVMIFGDVGASPGSSPVASPEESSGASDTAVLALLRRCQHHPHPRVQEETMTSYGKVKQPEAERYLLAGLDEKDPTLCGRAVVALGARHSTHERVLRFLTETLRRKGKQEHEADDRLQINACLALEPIVTAHPRVAGSFKPLLQEALAKDTPLLSSLTGQKFHPKSPEVRQAMQRVLARIDHLDTAKR